MLPWYRKLNTKNEIKAIINNLIMYVYDVRKCVFLGEQSEYRWEKYGFRMIL